MSKSIWPVSKSVPAKFYNWAFSIAFGVVFLFSASSHASTSRLSLNPEYLAANVLVTELGGFNQVEKTYEIAFFVWYETSRDLPNVLTRLKINGASLVRTREGATFEADNDAVVHRLFIEAKMHHDWRLHDYPFDIHTLSMEMELVDTSYDDIRFVTSSIIPVLDESLEVPKWSVIGGSVYATKRIRSSSLGSPAVGRVSGGATPLLEVSLVVKRDDTSGFWKMVITAFAAAGLAFTSYFIQLDAASAISARFGLIAGSVFADVVSMRQSAVQLGALDSVTLTDAVHMYVLAYIATAAVMSVYTHRHYRHHGDSDFIRTADFRAAMLSSSLLVLGILSLILPVAG